jgi:hypothetical protein
VWNVNACNAVVGAFNLQGSAWDRTRRQYTTYTKSPPTLSAEVRVRDVPPFVADDLRQRRQRQRSAAANGAEGNGSTRLGSERGARSGASEGAAAVPRSWVALRFGEEEIHRLRADEGVPVTLAGVRRAAWETLAHCGRCCTTDAVNLRKLCLLAPAACFLLSWTDIWRSLQILLDMLMECLQAG